MVGLLACRLTAVGDLQGPFRGMTSAGTTGNPRVHGNEAGERRGVPSGTSPRTSRHPGEVERVRGDGGGCHFESVHVDLDDALDDARLPVLRWLELAGLGERGARMAGEQEREKDRDPDAMFHAENIGRFGA